MCTILQLRSTLKPKDNFMIILAIFQSFYTLIIEGQAVNNTCIEMLSPFRGAICKDLSLKHSSVKR